MAKTTFSGPVRSESTIKTVSKNSSTGVITEVTTFGDSPVALADENKTLTDHIYTVYQLAFSWSRSRDEECSYFAN